METEVCVCACDGDREGTMKKRVCVCRQANLDDKQCGAWIERCGVRKPAVKNGSRHGIRCADVAACKHIATIP